MMMHVVQVSLDTTLLDPITGGEARERQVAYARELEHQRRGSRFTTLILTTRGSAPFTIENHDFVPVAGMARGRFRLWRALCETHARCPIDVITCQRVYDEAWIALRFAGRVDARTVGQIHFDLFNAFARRENFKRWIIGWLRYRLALRSISSFDAIRAVGAGIERTVRARGLNTNVVTCPVLMPMVGQAVSPVERRPQVLYVGRLVAQKNMSAWLRVCRRITATDPDVRFVVAGDGPLRPKLEREAERLGLKGRVEWKGFVPYAELTRLYAESSVFLLTSHYEGFGRVVAEAGTCGCPVVATHITGVEDIVENGATGFLVQPGDENELARRCHELLADAGRVRAMGAAAQARIARLFNPERLIRDWIRILTGSGEAWVP